MIEERKGQFSEKLLSLVEYLTQPDWDKRKKINLKEVINQLKRTKPISQTENFTDMFYRQMSIGENIFFENHPEYKK
jgi:hypothetical protein